MSDDKTSNFSGYGIIPKQVMKDTRLTIEAKAIYCYLCSYAGNDGYAFPSLELITSELKIDKNRFYKHLDILIKTGFISKSKEKNSKGQYRRVFYKLNPLYKNTEIVEKPLMQNKEVDIKPLMQNEEVAKIKENQSLSLKPFMQNDGMEKKPLLQNPVMENAEYTNNSITINNNNILLSSYEDSVNDKSFTQTPYEEIKNLFNNICVTLPKIRDIKGSRQKTVRQRWKENPDINFFKDLFEKVNNSDFLSGRSGKWKACFDWIIKPSNLQKIIEGNYDNKDINNNWSDFDVGC
ncbi:helix-turn-helix domain-containing protein [Caloramator sp. E03]|uniref:helix-turn-helix domain-containing protein n=1 Tax=Caloramator sp. E03 TaxID=2576307 RepID=UPI001110AAF7|nr:helix-turn-helix domain-containing protein [Caloramator sp. E03]QCX33501.1 helix-turn-helix domain-containing protein [Caloramator sp. E03]